MPRSVAILVCLLAAGLMQAAVSVDAAAQGAYRAKSPEYGLSAFLFDRPETTGRDLAKVQDVGFGWIKLHFPWAGIEQAGKGVYDWSEADRVVRAAGEAGLKIVARLDRQPAWARADRAFSGPPDDYKDYADFVSAFVGRYATGSEVGRVHAIQVWNEPNLTREWGGQRITRESAADYVRLLAMANRAAKAADPTVTVIGGNLAPTGVADPACCQPDDWYLQWMFEAGLKGNYDVLGAHANVQCPCVGAQPGSVQRFHHASFYFRRVEQLREMMVAKGDPERQIWLMEFGWTTDPIHESYAWYATDEATKSELIVSGFKYARANWTPWIGVMALWTIADPAWGPQDEQVWWAVTNPDGTTRPAYDRLLQARETGELP